MFKQYHKKRPIYHIWQYKGEDNLPEEVFYLMNLSGIKARVIISQHPKSYRYLEITYGKDVTTDVFVGSYIIIGQSDSGTTVRVQDGDISDYEAVR